VCPRHCNYAGTVHFPNRQDCFLEVKDLRSTLFPMLTPVAGIEIKTLWKLNFYNKRLITACTFSQRTQTTLI